MSRLMRFLVLLCVIFVSGQTIGKAELDPIPPEPDALVQKLYSQVIVRHPLGIPSGENWKVFAPFLSKDLIHRIILARSCQNDWARQNHGKLIKEPVAWGETGLFSGDEELSEPSSFQIQGTEPNQNGSFRVNVKLTESPPNDKAWTWNVEVYVKMQERRFVVDDVVFLKGDGVPAEHRLSEILTEGCKGSHWVGYGNNSAKP